MAEGRVPKDIELRDGFNPDKKVNLSAAELRRVKLEKIRLEKEEKRRQREVEKLTNQLAGLSDRVNKTFNDEEDAEEDKDIIEGMAEPDEKVNAKSAYQMLQDMRYVYRKVRGRKRLKELVEDDDKQFVFMVKELMKIEAALLAAKIRKDGGDEGSVNQNFFVILKGLEDEKKVLEDKTIDLPQITRALDPAGV